MTKEYLKSYRLWDRRIEELSEEIHGSVVSDTVLSAADFPYSQHPVGISGAPPDTDERRWELERKRAYLMGRCREIRRWVNAIPDPITREVFEFRYILGDRMPTWQEIAQRIGGGNGESSVRMRVQRFLENE